MESKIISLGKKRAEDGEDCRLWTPLEALEDLVAEIKAGHCNPEQLVVHYFEQDADGGKSHHYQAAGVTFPEHIALLSVSQARILDDWRR